VIGATGTEFEQTCPDPYAAPASQGADGWVSPLPAGFGDGTHVITVKGDATPAGHDLDVYYLDASCAVIGSTATAAPDESGVIPGGTAYVLTQLWTGVQVPFTLTATDAG
jgi:extracellular elastinolytic metalloproteinase